MKNTYEPADIRIYTQKDGLVLNEKSLVAFKRNTALVVAVGNEAECLQNEEENVVVSPIKQGELVDYIVAEKMFVYFLKKAWGEKHIRRPCVAFCLSEPINPVLLKVYEDAIYQAGAKEVIVKNVPAEQFIQKMKEEPKNRVVKCDICIEVTKDEPVVYLKEQIAEMIEKAEKMGLAKEDIVKMVQQG